MYNHLKKYLRINLTKRQKTSTMRTMKHWRKKLEEDTSRWKDFLCPWIVRSNSVKKAVLLKATYKFNAIPTKIPMIFSQK
jgi:hypothetical protein